GFGSLNTRSAAQEKTTGESAFAEHGSPQSVGHEAASGLWPRAGASGGLVAPARQGEASVDNDLQEMLDDLRGNTAELKPTIDYETHYSLGLAYKDMGLVDEAIEQFQFAFRLAQGNSEDDHIQCCHMLGVCFHLKGMPKLAIMWYQRGLKVMNRSEDEYQALRFEIGLCYEEIGEVDRAIEAFTEVYGVDVNYRHVSEKIRQLQASRDA